MTGRLDPPDGYDDTRRTIWTQTVNRLTERGQQFRADPDVLNAYVEAVLSHQQASTLLRQTNVLTVRDGHAVENPALAVQRRTAASIVQLSRSLGLGRNPMAPLGDTTPMATDQPGRWCETHGRLECTKQRNKGGDCHAVPVKGLDVCKNHGGKPLAALKRDGEVARARVYGEPLDVTPVVGLLEEVRWSAGHVAALRAQVVALEDAGPDATPGQGGLWWGAVKSVNRDGVMERTEQAALHIVLQAYNAERAHFARVCAAAIAAGAQQQLIDQAKATGALVGRLMDAVFARLDLQPWQQARLPQVVPAVLREFGQPDAIVGEVEP